MPMDLVGIRVELPTNTPIMLLREKGGDRYLPIWIGTPEATAIAMAHDGIETNAAFDIAAQTDVALDD